MTILAELWADDQGQNIAEYAVMFAAILVVVIRQDTASRFKYRNVFSAVAWFDPVRGFSFG